MLEHSLSLIVLINIIISENSIEIIPSEIDRRKILMNIFISLKNNGVFITSFHSPIYPKILLFMCFNNIRNILTRKMKINDCALKIRKFKGENCFFIFIIVIGKSKKI